MRREEEGRRGERRSELKERGIASEKEADKWDVGEGRGEGYERPSTGGKRAEWKEKKESSAYD